MLCHYKFTYLQLLRQSLEKVFIFFIMSKRFSISEKEQKIVGVLPVSIFNFKQFIPSFSKG